MKQNNKNGFTLIDLMISVTIIGILAAITIPAYQNYNIRSQVSEGFILASGAKPLVTEYHANRGFFPESNLEIGYPGAVGNYISHVEVNRSGTIVATFGDGANEKIRGKKVILSPLNIDGPIDLYPEESNQNIVGRLFDLFLGKAYAQETSDRAWNCYSNVEQKYLPSSCISKEIVENEESSQPVISKETQTVSCSGGMIGNITQERNVTTYSNGRKEFGNWITTANNCVTPEPTVTTENRSQSCEPGFEGSIEQQRTVTTAPNGQVSYGGWNTISNSCTAIPPTVTTETRNQTCQEGYEGNITESRSITTTWNGVVTEGAWTQTANTCTAIPPVVTYGANTNVACTTYLNQPTKQYNGKVVTRTKTTTYWNGQSTTTTELVSNTCVEKPKTRYYYFELSMYAGGGGGNRNPCTGPNTSYIWVTTPTYTPSPERCEDGTKGYTRYFPNTATLIRYEDRY